MRAGVLACDYPPARIDSGYSRRGFPGVASPLELGLARSHSSSDSCDGKCKYVLPDLYVILHISFLRRWEAL